MEPMFPDEHAISLHIHPSIIKDDPLSSALTFVIPILSLTFVWLEVIDPDSAMPAVVHFTISCGHVGGSVARQSHFSVFASITPSPLISLTQVLAYPSTIDISNMTPTIKYFFISSPLMNILHLHLPL
jgi:hypothetical protein